VGLFVVHLLCLFPVHCPVYYPIHYPIILRHFQGAPSLFHFQEPSNLDPNPA
jgi:hypothetical protein